MPVKPPVSYPGVYIQEVESDIHTITPVDTATTAFIGRALRGPIDDPVVINSFADFQRIFGGLWKESNLGFAVNQFFLNGGSKAVIVRVFHSYAKRWAKCCLKDEQDQDVWFTAKAPGEEGIKLTIDVANVSNEADEDWTALVEQLGKPDEWACVEIDGKEPSYYKLKNDGIGDALFEAKTSSSGEPLSVTITPVAEMKPVIENQLGTINDWFKLIVKDKSQEKVLQRIILTEKHETKSQNEHYIGTVLNDKDMSPWIQVGPSQENQSRLKVISAKEFSLDPAEKPEGSSCKTRFVAGGVHLHAKNSGAWYNRLDVTINHPTYEEKIAEDLKKRYEVDDAADLFDLQVREGENVLENIKYLSLKKGTRQIGGVLEKESQLISYEPTNGTGLQLGSETFIPAEKEETGDDGDDLDFNDVKGDPDKKTGIYALDKTDIFNLLYIPPYEQGTAVSSVVLTAAAEYCRERRAFLLVDPPGAWNREKKAITGFPINEIANNSNAAIYFPNIKVANPLRDNQLEELGPCGAVAGIMARTDATRGVWKAPAGLETSLRGVSGLSVGLTDAENGLLNPLGINCLRQMPAAGFVVWGARTLSGDDRLSSQWKYIPVRRTALYIEESLYRGTKWAVFEPNDEPLWSQLRLNIGVFMHGLFRQGAFQGQSPKEAYFVKCDKTTTTQADIDRGIVNIIVGFAPLKPAEFVILYIQQIAGQLAA